MRYGPEMELAHLVEAFLDAHFPSATIAVVGGSTAAGRRTATSDIDLLVIGPVEMLADDRDALATFIEFEGEGFEVFAYSPDAFERWVENDLDSFRPVLLDILLRGVAVRSSPQLAPLRERWSGVLEQGPTVDAHDLDLRRYMLTDVLDDLADATDALETRVLADRVFTGIAELLLLSHGRWLGAGKWLVRRLREWDTARCDALSEPLLVGDMPRFLEAVERELDAVGGRMQAGFTR